MPTPVSPPPWTQSAVTHSSTAHSSAAEASRHQRGTVRGRRCGYAARPVAEAGTAMAEGRSVVVTPELWGPILRSCCVAAVWPR